MWGKGEGIGISLWDSLINSVEYIYLCTGVIVNIDEMPAANDSSFKIAKLKKIFAYKHGFLSVLSVYHSIPSIYNTFNNSIFSKSPNIWFAVKFHIFRNDYFVQAICGVNHSCYVL